MPPYVSPHAYGAVNQDVEFEEMAQMLYNPMGPFFDSPMLFSPMPCYVNPSPVGGYPGGEMPIYAHDGAGLVKTRSPNQATTPSLRSTSNHSILMQDVYDIDPVARTSDAPTGTSSRNPTR
ncbi:unnamed protein product [Rhizoctonia solani]|uniref:Uncharacterized protein n=1 Tax=Rhizoctonia solani TaxID=456999 RepID=A0A8H2WZT2_9AGAM|nr:unnamed protein product [Rhizoctonia solani]